MDAQTVAIRMANDVWELCTGLTRSQYVGLVGYFEFLITKKAIDPDTLIKVMDEVDPDPTGEPAKPQTIDK